MFKDLSVKSQLDDQSGDTFSAHLMKWNFSNIEKSEVMHVIAQVAGQTANQTLSLLTYVKHRAREVSSINKNSNFQNT